jgi:hypothetical protein
MRGFVIGVGLVALVLATVVSQFAAPEPDGLERVARDQGIIAGAQDHALAWSPFADYATQGLGNEALSLAVAGVVGVVITLLVGLGIVYAVRGRGASSSQSSTPARSG